MVLLDDSDKARTVLQGPSDPHSSEMSFDRNQAIRTLMMMLLTSLRHQQLQRLQRLQGVWELTATLRLAGHELVAQVR
jgi:hypothetical protein